MPAIIRAWDDEDRKRVGREKKNVRLKKEAGSKKK